MNTAKTYSRMRAVQATLLTAVLFAAAVGIFACKSNDSTTGAPEVTYITPNAPSSVTLIPLNASIVRLVWVESEKKVFTGFLIQRKQGISGVWTDLSRVGAAFRTYTDSNLVLDQYFYRIFTFNETAYSRPSFEVSVNTATVVVAPTKLAISNVSTSHVELRWTDNSNNETGFRIERTLISGDSTDVHSFVDSVSAGVSSYIDNTAPCGSLLAYRVRAIGIGTQSNFSNPITVSVPYTSPLALTTGSRSELNSVIRIGEMSAIAVGASGTILRTDNNGDEWVKLKSATTSALNAVQAVTNDVIYAVGDRGRILRTNDGGVNWVLQPNTKTASLFSVFFFSPDTGFVCGQSGLIMVTKNGGTDWSSVSSGSAGDLRCITFTSRKVGYCVGAAGVVLRTQNGGLNWSVIHTGVPNTFNGASFYNDSLGYVVGSRGIILRTTNMGGTWQTQSNPYGGDVLCVSFPAKNRVLVASGQTTLLFTVNDGRTWVKIPIAATSTNLNGIVLSADGSGMLVGGSGAAWRLEGCH